MIKTYKFFALIILVFSLGTMALGQKKIVHPIKPKDFDGLGITNDFKVLAEGLVSNVDQPFVFVAHDQKTYAQLQNLAGGLPEMSGINFRENAVVAGFAGERPTGGWTVEIRKFGKKVLVDLKAPRKGLMVTQMITTPFKVSLIPINGNEALPIDLTTSYKKNVKTFRVTEGEFEFVGGIAGIKKTFKATGTIGLLSFGEIITVLFDLKGKGAAGQRKLSETVSGSFKIGDIKLFRLDAGNFVDFPHSPFEVNGLQKGKKLSLNFVSLPAEVADGFDGKGSLEAILVK